MLELLSYPFTAMGTACVLHIYSFKQGGDEVAQRAISEVCRIEARYSRYRTDSVLSEINRAAKQGASVEVDEETAGLLDYAWSCYQKSDGLFDISSGILRRAWDFSQPRLPEQKAIDLVLPHIGLEKIIWDPPRLTFTLPGLELDLGGICKEYAADRAAAVCMEQGIEHGLIDLGGDIHVIGPSPIGEPWHIQINHPRNPEASIATIEIRQGSLATSGDYERYIELAGTRYCHILNPFTGRPVHALSSVSVLAADCLVAGTLSTIAMLKEKKGIQWLLDMNVPHLWMDEAGGVGGTLPSSVSL